MKFPPTRYLRPVVLDQALDALNEYKGSIKVLAGGQSLLPLMAMRLADPDILLDINDLAELQEIRDLENCVEIGALIRHQRLIDDPIIQRHAPVLSLVARHIGHLAIRHRGTIGGSLVHCDPAAELPLAVQALDGELLVQSVGQSRRLPAENFFLSYLMSAVEHHEMLTAIRIPKLMAHTRFAFDEVSGRTGDFALVSALAIITLSDDESIQVARLAIGGVSEVPFRVYEAEQYLTDAKLTRDVIDGAASIVHQAVNPEGDLHASADYRRHLAGVLTNRVLTRVGVKGDLSWNR